MKTLEDLKALIPIIIDLLRNNDHEIGTAYYDQEEDGWGRICDSASNSIYFEEDGWFIEVDYDCCGDLETQSGDYWTPSSCELKKAWGEVTEIIATHYDEESGDETIFENDDLNELWDVLDKELKDIA